ncbi:MAG: CotH kinase family protein [Oscillospiraceae bacterium]|nr:CotH kinase family protein [Oscillospiraceae bacterium]
MRRTIIYYLAGLLAVAILVVSLVYIGASDDVRRYHQHLERPSEADLGYCFHCDDHSFCTHLPLIIIDTFGQEIPGRPLAFGTGFYNDPETLFAFHYAPDGEAEIEVAVSVIDNPDSWNHADDIPMYESLAMMRIRGNSSRFFEKPNYRINLIHPDAENNPLPLLGMNPHTEWALHGPFLDKTLMRNYIWMNAAADVMGPGHFVPEVRFFELILNGEYQGLYMLMETIRVSPYRLDMTRYREGMPVTSYLFRLDTNFRTPERHVNTFSALTYRLEMRRNMEIMYPSLALQSDSIQEYVTRNISTIERFLYSPEIIWDTRRYEQYIDMDSFVNFYIINEFIGNNDLWANSTFVHKDVRGRLVAGPVWDFNNVMDNFFLSMPTDRFLLADRGWFDRLMMCPDFTDRVIRRWRTLRRGVLAEEQLVQYMQDVEDWLGSAIDRNFEVWGYSFDPSQVSRMERRVPTYAQRVEGLTIFDLNPSSFEEAQEWARNYMIERGRFLDDYIEALRQFSHPSRHALWIVP